MILVAVGLHAKALFFILSGVFLQTELFEGDNPYESIESIILAASGVFSLLLLSLSVLAYKRTGIKKIIFAAIAFSLFAIQLILEALEETTGILEEPPIGDILSSAMTLAILVLFFLAIVRKNN
jgi:hypothetical protein